MSAESYRRKHISHHQFSRFVHNLFNMFINLIVCQVRIIALYYAIPSLLAAKIFFRAVARTCENIDKFLVSLIKNMQSRIDHTENVMLKQVLRSESKAKMPDNPLGRCKKRSAANRAKQSAALKCRSISKSSPCNNERSSILQVGNSAVV